MVAGYAASAPASQETGMWRFASRDFCRFGHVRLCTVMPYACVTYPLMASPGRGLQQRAMRVSMPFNPSVTTRAGVCAERFLLGKNASSGRVASATGVCMFGDSSCFLNHASIFLRASDVFTDNSQSRLGCGCFLGGRPTSAPPEGGG